MLPAQRTKVPTQFLILGMILLLYQSQPTESSSSSTEFPIPIKIRRTNHSSTSAAASPPGKVSIVQSSHKKRTIPLLVGHRGDNSIAPEDTIQAYDNAILQNVDYIEPSLLLTKDLILVCHHNLTLRNSTDVSSRPEFASLMRTNHTISWDGKPLMIWEDWLISDFTFEELKTLKVSQFQKGIPEQHFNGLFTIPSFEEFIEVLHEHTWKRKQDNYTKKIDFVTGMIPELVNPAYHNKRFGRGNLMEYIFLFELEKNGYMSDSCHHEGNKIPCSPLIIQTFDLGTIKYLRRVSNFPLMTLLDTRSPRHLTYQGMKELKNTTDYLGLWKELLYTGTETEMDYENVTFDEKEIKKLGGFIPPRAIVNFGHSLGFKIGIYTIYDSHEESKRVCAIECKNHTKEEELKYYFEMGVDLICIEGISEGIKIREEYFRNAEGENNGNSNNKTNGNDDDSIKSGSCIGPRIERSIWVLGGKAMILLIGTVLRLTLTMP